MRTTLTIDDDVAAELERLRRKGDLSFKEVVNEVLRKGLHEARIGSERRKSHRTETIKGVKPLIDNMDNVAEILSYAEGDDFK